MKQIFFLGSYAKSGTSGIYVCSFDPSTGAIRMLNSYAGLDNPTFLAVHPQKRMLYAIGEAVQPDGSKHGVVAAFCIDEHYNLTLLAIEKTVPASTCHIALDRTGQYVLVSSYHGGMVGLSPVGDDGRPGAAADIRVHQGSSVHPAQTQSRAHSATMDLANRYAVVCDLGTDRIITYKLDAAENKLLPQSEAKVAPGAGPRHFAFHPTMPFGYCINELNSTITAFAYDEERGSLTEIQTVPALPEHYDGDNACADIHISADGTFLYGSNRGHDSIAVFRIAEADGRLALVEHASALGRHPRNFALSPDGAYLLAANRDTDNVTVLARDRETGRLTPAGQEIAVSKPVCIAFL